MQSGISFPWKTNMPMLILREENLKWTVRAFSACCSVTCFLIGKEVPEARSQLSGIFSILHAPCVWLVLSRPVLCRQLGRWSERLSICGLWSQPRHGKFNHIFLPLTLKNLNTWLNWHHQHWIFQLEWIYFSRTLTSLKCTVRLHKVRIRKPLALLFVLPLGFLHEKIRHALFLPAYSLPVLLQHVSLSLLLLAVNVSVLLPRLCGVISPVIFSCFSCKTWPHFIWMTFLYSERKNFFILQSWLIFGA